MWRRDEFVLDSHYLSAFRDSINIEELKKKDYYAIKLIEELQAEIKEVEDYRKKLFEHTQKVLEAREKLYLLIARRQDRYNNHIYYEIRVYKKREGFNGETIIYKKTYEGRERHKALKEYKELCNKYKNAERIEYLK